MSFDPQTATLMEDETPRFNPRGKLTLVEEGPTVSGRAGLLGDIPSPSFMQLGTTRLPTPPENVEVSRIPSEAEQQAMLTGVAQPETGFPSVPKLDKETLTTLGVPEAAAKPIAGAQQAIASVADFFMTPWGVATLGIGGLAPEAGKAFAAAYVEQMAESAPEQFVGAYKKLQEGDTEGAARDLTGGLAAIGFVGHALAPHARVAIERAKNQIAASRVGEPDLAAADVAARQASRIRDTAGEVIPQPELPPLPIAKEPTPETQPLPKQLSEEDVQRLFLEPEAKRVEEELAKGAPALEPALPVEHETVLPTATDAFKEIVGETPKTEAQAPVAPKVTNPLTESPENLQGESFSDWAKRTREAGNAVIQGLEPGNYELVYPDGTTANLEVTRSKKTGKITALIVGEGGVEELRGADLGMGRVTLPDGTVTWERGPTIRPKAKAPSTPQVEPQAVEPTPRPEIKWSRQGELRRNADGDFEWVEDGEVLDTAKDPTELVRAFHEDNAGYSTRVRQVNPDKFELDLGEHPEGIDAVHELVPYDPNAKLRESLPPSPEPTPTPKVEPAAAPTPALTESGAPKAAGETAKPAETPKAPKRKGIERPWDIIDELLSTVGTIRRKSAAKPGTEGYYTPEFHALSQSGASRKLFGPTGASPDEALSAAIKSGFLGEDATVADLENLISRANAQRRAISQGQTPEIRADKFQSALAKQGAKKSSQVISVGDLGKQDKFKIQGEEFEVVSIDPDTGEVTVRDGKKFGHQTIPDGADVPVEKGSFIKAPQSEEFLPEEPTETPAIKTPKLGRGETQGDLISSTQREDFALVGERGTDQERLAAEKAKAAQLKKEAEELAKKQQMELPGAEPPLQSMGGALHGEDLGSQGNVVSNMFAAIDRDRAAMGKPPMEPGQPRTWGEDQQRAMARMNRDPNWTTDLINEVLDHPRPLLSWEHAGLVLQKAYWKAEENNAASRISRAFDDGRTDDLVEAKADQARFEDNLERLERAVRRGGTGSEAGRTLQAQKMGLTDDLSLIEMRLGVRAKAGGRRLTEQESNQLEKIHAEYQENLKKITAKAQASERAAVEANARASLAELARQAAETKVPPPHIQTIIKRIGDVIHSQANKARERLKGKLFTIGDPEVLLDLARVGADNIWTIGEDFARWSAKMIEDIGERIKPHLHQVWEASKKFIEDTTDAESGAKKAARGSKQEKVAETVKATIKKGDTPEQKIGKLTARIEDRVNKGQKLKIGSSVQALARSFMEQGIRDRDEVVKAVHDVLERVIPDWTLYDTKQAISGYGDYKTLTKDEISVALRDVKGQLQQILKLEDMARGEAPLKTGRERREVTKAQSELIKLVNEAKRKGGYTTTDPEKQLRTALDEVKKRTQTAIDEYERRLREKDFSVRKLEPVRPDPELLSLQADQKRIKKKYEQVKRDVELANRSAWQKTLDKFVRWERAFKLSSPVVFGKLTAAAITRVATTGVEEAVGSVARFLPGLSKVAEQAPREGTGLSVSMFAKALAKAITEGMKDAAQTLTKGAADIDVEYGEKLVDKDWANVFGQLHGMLKAPIKRFEFEYSLAKRIEFAQKHGVDVTDKLEMARLSAEALNEGYRSIFMQHGFSSDMFNQIVSQMERSTKYPVAGEISARVARFLMPVVRVPANIVAETATGIHGSATGSLRVLFHAINGTLKTLKPEVADSIMRQFKKGSIGLGLMAIGYFNPQVVGGYDWREKRRPGAAKTAGFQVKQLAGVWPVDDQGNVPRWLTHAPWFELMQFGATLRHVKDQHVKGQEKGIGEGLWAAGLGLVEETPLINEMLHVDRIFDPAKRDQFLGELGRSTLIPQAMQKYAEWQDDFTQRKPKGVLQNIEMGVPYLRKNVPLKPPPGTTRNFVPVRAY